MTFVLILVAAAAIWTIAAPGARFLPQFGRLLTAPTIERGRFSYFSGRSYLRGGFHDRDVAVRLQLKRSRYAQGYLVMALRLAGSAALDGSGGSIDARTHDEAGRRASTALAGHDLQLSVEEGWLKALWQPQSWFLFPGQFSPDKWRQVLDNMRTLARSLEGAAWGVRRDAVDGG